MVFDLSDHKSNSDDDIFEQNINSNKLMTAKYKNESSEKKKKINKKIITNDDKNNKKKDKTRQKQEVNR